MYMIVWRYTVPADRTTDFVRAYGPAGDWVVLFRGAPGFIGTELVACDEPGTYLTIDRWTSRAAFESFHDVRRAEYDHLDAQTAHLTDDEVRIGGGVAIDPTG